MRLIDTDELISVLKQTGIIVDNDKGHLVIDEINRIPIAYDVDKVVENLEKQKVVAFLTLSNTGNKELDIAYQYIPKYINLAIETVKAGGIDGEINN